jgi:hypothetical protein
MEDGERMGGRGLLPVKVVQKALRVLCSVCSLLALVHAGGCKGMPTLEQQEQLVRENNLVLDHLTTRAVVNVWGEPPHYRSQFTQFFVMPDFSMIPSVRVTSGETPRGWSASVHAGEGIYFAYPDRGWLLVFLDDRLVYKEELKAEEMRTLVKTWEYEDRFKTRLDGTPVP